MDYTIYIQISEDEDLELSKADIEQSENREQLQEWHDLVADAVEDLRVIVKANEEVGESNTSLNFKYGRYKLAEHWLSKRLKKIAAPDDEKDKRIKGLVEHIAVLEVAIAKRNATIALLSGQVSPQRECA